MSKLIYMKNGRVTVVDDDIYNELSQYKWNLDGRGYVSGLMCKKGEAKWGIKHKPIKLHRHIMSAPQDKQVDHINGDILDNRRENLRLVNQSQNSLNAKIYKTSKSGVRGVSWYKRDKKWRAHIFINYKQIHLGYYDSIEEARLARNNAEVKYKVVNNRE